MFEKVKRVNLCFESKGFRVYLIHPRKKIYRELIKNIVSRKNKIALILLLDIFSFKFTFSSIISYKNELL